MLIVKKKPAKGRITFKGETKDEVVTQKQDWLKRQNLPGSRFDEVNTKSFDDKTGAYCYTTHLIPR